MFARGKCDRRLHLIWVLHLRAEHTHTGTNKSFNFFFSRHFFLLPLFDRLVTLHSAPVSSNVSSAKNCSYLLRSDRHFVAHYRLREFCGSKSVSAAFKDLQFFISFQLRTLSSGFTYKIWDGLLMICEASCSLLLYFLRKQIESLSELTNLWHSINVSRYIKQKN